MGFNWGKGERARGKVRRDMIWKMGGVRKREKGKWICKGMKRQRREGWGGIRETFHNLHLLNGCI